jgi:peroxiredoxin (alkyl hydroperoxide reductase subunit C)
MPFPMIQQKAPAFTASALLPNKEFKDISLSDYLGQWVVFFWYPLDFTFVCPTEIIAFGDRQPEFTSINTQVIAASCDSLFTHLAWVNTARNNGGLGDMKIPIVADFNKTVATQYGVLLPDGIPLRALFIIDPTGTLRQITCNDLPVGRNVDEIIRLVKAFQFVEEHGEVCPANWQPGDLTMKADPTASKEYFGAANKSAESTGGSVKEIGDKDEFATATSRPGLTVVDYWAPWCKNCKKIGPLISKLSSELSEVHFVKVNTQEAETLAADQGVDALPSFQFFKAGKMVGSFKGSDAEKIEAAIRAHM